MKFRTIVASIAAFAAVVSCGKKEVSLTESLAGKWSGSNKVELTITDSLGNTVIQEFMAPINFEYLADSTFSAEIAINDSSIVKLGGIVTSVTDSAVVVAGTMSCEAATDITGEFKMNPDNSLSISYTGSFPERGLIHKGAAIVTRKNE